MGKAKYLVIALVFVAVIGLGIYGLGKATGFFSLFGGEEVAVLNISKGVVQVSSGKDWVSAVDGMGLSESEGVKTLANSEAAVVLYESIIINLDPETEIYLSNLTKEHVKVSQPKGTTWNKFTGLAGVEGYSVETPNSVATVRGTWFKVGMTEILVLEGIVSVEYKGQTFTLEEGDLLLLDSGSDSNHSGGTITDYSSLSPEEKAVVAGKLKDTVEELKELRAREIDKIKDNLLVREVMDSYGISDSNIAYQLDKADSGGYDLNELINKSPVKTDSMYTIKDLTEQIIEHNKQIEKLSVR